MKHRDVAGIGFADATARDRYDGQVREAPRGDERDVGLDMLIYYECGLRIALEIYRDRVLGDEKGVVEPAVHHLEQLADEDETKEDAHGNEAIAFMDAQMVVVGFNYGVGRGGKGGVSRGAIWYNVSC